MILTVLLYTIHQSIELVPVSAGEHGHGRHSCCHEHRSGSVVPDPSQVTQSEWSEACAQATAALEQAVTCINEALEKIRYEVLDDGPN